MASTFVQRWILRFKRFRLRPLLFRRDSVRSSQSVAQRSHAFNGPEPTPHQDTQDQSKSAVEFDANALEAEIRAARKFSLADAIGKEGGSFLKSSAAIPRPLRATNAINQFIQTCAAEPTGALSTTLQQWASQDIGLSRQLDTPLKALADILSGLLREPTTFCEFARQVAIAHAQLTGDRPYFQLRDQPPHPDADYTHDAIRAELKRLLQQLQSAALL